MAFFVKGIKPKRFKSEAFLREMQAMMDRFGKDVKKDFEKTTATWKKKPKFETVTDTSAGEIAVLVATDDEIYKFTDEGTKPHPIFAGIYTGKSNKKTLAFSSTSRPKTTPNVIGSNPGVVGKRDTFVPFVQHPGTKARNFTKIIEAKWRRPFKRRAEAAMRKANKSAGHSAR